MATVAAGLPECVGAVEDATKFDGVGADCVPECGGELEVCSDESELDSSL